MCNIEKKLNEMFLETIEAKTKLNDVSQLERFKDLFTEGEQTSIREIIKTLKVRQDVLAKSPD
jgi:hypothetical protein